MCDIFKRQIGVFILLCFIFSCSISHSQNPLHKQLTVSTGFFSNTVYDIYQDKKGFIWFATDDGLVRYDGINYKEYPIKGNKSSSVTNILETNDGRIWVQNFSGQFFFTKNDSLHYKPQLSVLQNFMLASVIDGELIAVVQKKGIRLFNSRTNKYTDIPLNTESLKSAVHSPTNEFLLIAPKNDTFFSIDRTGKVVVSKSKHDLSNCFYYSQLDNKKLLVTKIDDYIYYGSRKIKLKNKLKDSFIQNVSFISENEACILTSSGFLFLGKNCTQSAFNFKEYSCSKVIKDREGNYWVGTINDGVLFIPHFSVKHYLSGRSITSVFANNATKKYLIGTKYNEIFTYDPISNKINLLVKNTVNHEVKCVHQNEYTNEILFCSEFFYHLDKQLNLKKSIPISCNNISSLDSSHYLLSESSCLSIYPVTENDPWMKWKTSKRQLQNGRLSLTDGNKRFFDAHFQDGKIIAHSIEGLWEMSQTGERKLLYCNKKIEVLGLEKCKKGVLIMTTNNTVLLYQNGKISPFISKNQFVSKRLYRIKASERFIFVLTYSGIEIFDFNGKKLFDLMSSDGFPGIDVVEFDALDDLMLTGNAIGLIPIRADKSIINTHLPTIHLDQLKINQKIIQLKTNSLLKTDENTLQFSFSVLDFRSQNTNILYYSINGKKWVALPAYELNLNELQYGKYHILVKVMNERGQFSKDKFEFNFEINTPIYKRLWFILLMVFVSLAVISLIVWLRFNEIRSKNTILQEKIVLEKQLYQSTLSSIKAQMNPHFLFNSLNTIQSFIYTGDRQTASNYLVNFSELTRMILEMSNKEKVLLSDEIRALELYLQLEKMRFEDSFTYEINSNKLQHLSYQIPSMLIQPYVENAIKHGLLHIKGIKNVKIMFQKQDGVLLVEITDNGIGISASRELNRGRTNHQSFATEANQKRFKVLNELSDKQIGVEISDILDKYGQVAGTKVALAIPL